MVPTKERNHPGTFVTYRTEGILIDCGEGIQRQMKIANIPVTKVTKLLISHWHGDHVLGIPGLIQTLASTRTEKKLEIYGPKGTKKRLDHVFKAFIFDNKIDLEVIEIGKRKIFEGDRFYIEAWPLDHGVPTYGFNIIEKDWRKVDMKKAQKLGIKQGPMIGKLADGKSVTVDGKRIKPDNISSIIKGKKLSYISDTALCKNCYNMSKDADLLISECSYTSDLEDKAEKYDHMTAKQAALVASRNKVKRLILNHFSARYKSAKVLEDEAKDVFENSKASFDFMKAKI